MRLDKCILIAIVFAFALGLAALRCSFACWTGPQYQTDCCEAGSFDDKQNYCCKSEGDCFTETFENCRFNSYRLSVPCICPIGVLLNDEMKIDTLRRFRDEVLSQTPIGQEYIRLYYEWSPAIVQAMEEDDYFKEELKELIDEMLPMIEKAME